MNLKRFVRDTLLFLLIVPFLFYGSSLYLLLSGEFSKYISGSIVYEAIERSKKKSKAKKILLGDSVGEQLFPGWKENDTVLSLASNESIGMAGQFLLLSNFLKEGNRPDTVFLLFNPLSFQNSMKNRNTYQCFMKPFDNAEYKGLFSESLNRQLDKMPLRGWSQNTYIKTSDWVPDATFFSWPENSDTLNFLSDISAEYLLKIKALSSQYNFSVRIIPCPVISSNRKRLALLNKSGISKYGLDDYFSNYFQSVIFLESDQFIDGYHLKHPENLNEVYRNKFGIH